jgi:hypothetical protein
MRDRVYPKQQAEPIPEAAREQEEEVPVRKVQPSCPPGDPMCGGL